MKGKIKDVCSQTPAVISIDRQVFVPSKGKGKFSILATFPGLKPSFKGTEPGPWVTEIRTAPRESEILLQFVPL